jgi:hypothetical protein
MLAADQGIASVTASMQLSRWLPSGSRSPILRVVLIFLDSALQQLAVVR